MNEGCDIQESDENDRFSLRSIGSINVENLLA